jgi:hypothetical protein
LAERSSRVTIGEVGVAVCIARSSAGVIPKVGASPFALRAF